MGYFLKYIEMLKKHTGKILLALVFFLMIGLSLVIYVKKVRPESVKKEDILVNMSSDGTIEPNKELQQDITVKNATIEEITIPVFYEKVDAKSQIKVVLSDKEKEIQKWTYSFSDDSIENISLELDDPIKVKGEKVFSLSFIDEGNYINGTGFLGKAMWDIPQTVLYENGSKASYDIPIYITGGDCSYIKIIFWSLFLLLIVGFCVVSYLSFVKKITAEKLFLILGGIFGIIYIFIWAPYSCPDEYQHISTAYYYASDILNQETVNEQGDILVRKEDLRYTPNEIATRRYTYKLLKDEWNTVETKETGNASFHYKPMREVSLLSYFPQIVAMLISRVLHLNNITWLILGRMFALFIYLAFGYLALKYIPFAKNAMLILMLGPTALQEAASFSYDSVLNTTSFLFIGYVLYIAYKKEKIRKWDFIILIVLAFILSPIKVVYLLLTVLVLLIPNVKISQDKIKAWLFKISVIFVGVISSMFSRMSSTKEMVASETNNMGVQGYSLKMLIEDPIRTFGLWGNTLKERTVYYVKQIFGGYEEYSKVEISWLVIIGFFILLTLALLVKETEEVMEWGGKCLLVFISVAIFFGTLLAFNLAKDCTNVNSACVFGIQGRYFLPFLPLIFIALQSKNIIVKKENIGKLCLGVYFLQFLSIWGIFETVIGR